MPPSDPAGIGRSVFRVDRVASALLIEARSTLGPIELGTAELAGTAEVAVTAAGIDPGSAPCASLQLRVESLTSGNALYDGEVYRRLDAQRYPTITVELVGARALAGTRWVLDGELTIHGTTRPMSGSVDIEQVDDDRLRVYGEQIIDIRDFAIALPNALMLRIYPDVLVRFRIEAVRGN